MNPGTTCPMCKRPFLKGESLLVVGVTHYQGDAKAETPQAIALCSSAACARRALAGITR